jgi:hypothetical protein
VGPARPSARRCRASYAIADMHSNSHHSLSSCLVHLHFHRVVIKTTSPGCRAFPLHRGLRGNAVRLLVTRRQQQTELGALSTHHPQSTTPFPNRYTDCPNRCRVSRPARRLCPVGSPRCNRILPLQTRVWLPSRASVTLTSCKLQSPHAFLRKEQPSFARMVGSDWNHPAYRT